MPLKVQIQIELLICVQISHSLGLHDIPVEEILTEYEQNSEQL